MGVQVGRQARARSKKILAIRIPANRGFPNDASDATPHLVPLSMADQRLGLRAITMQQPFAAAMAAGVGLFSRRGKPMRFEGAAGEWVAVHCGQNEEHLKNARLMKEIRRVWPSCPPDEALRAGQRSVLGVARFVDGHCDAKAASSSDVFLALYDCTKPVAWRADAARACAAPLPYPKGNLQIWHLMKSGFAKPSDSAELLQLARGAGAAKGEGGLEGGRDGGRKRPADKEAPGGERKGKASKR